MTRKREPDYWLTKSKKKQIKRDVMSRQRPSMRVGRKIRREINKRIRHGTFGELGLEMSKPGRFISEAYRSSRAFVWAYSFARSEEEFYNQSLNYDY